MCQIWTKATAIGREDHGDGVTIYRHEVDGFLIRTHRTVRVSPAGWVYGVYDSAGGQYTYGYAPTQREALRAASHYVIARCAA